MVYLFFVFREQPLTRRDISHCLCEVSLLNIVHLSTGQNCLRLITPGNKGGYCSELQVRPKRQRGQRKTKTFLLFLTNLFQDKDKKAHTETGSGLYCVSCEVHSATQKSSLRRFISFNSLLCSTWSTVIWIQTYPGQELNHLHFWARINVVNVTWSSETNKTQVNTALGGRSFIHSFKLIGSHITYFTVAMLTWNSR